MPPTISGTRGGVWRWRLPLFLLIGLVTAVAMYGIVIVLVSVFVVGAGQGEIVQRQRLILYKINPNPVLAACATIRAKQALFRGNPDWHAAKGGDMPDPADPQMPPVIATLRPCTITIQPSGVQIELGGGFYHFGLAEQMPRTPKPVLAVKQLVPGLWYYAEDGKVPPR